MVAVGDVSNSFDSIPIKRRSKITYHTFAEAFGFKPERADKAFGISKNIYGILKSNGMGASISPHSPYSVSEKLFQLIKKHAESNNSIISIHNQESRDENQFFQTGEGGIANHLKNNIGLDISGWKPTGKNSLQSILKYLPKDNQILLVHNTYTTINDLKVLKDTINSELLFLVLCPSSNLYIENALPPIQLFQKENLNICIGTDSLASNKELSMVNEMYTIQQQYPNIVLEELLKWGTINGAKALQLDKTIGTLEIGKRPGINLLTGIDLHKLKFSAQSKVKRLV